MNNKEYSSIIDNGYKRTLPAQIFLSIIPALGSIIDGIIIGLFFPENEISVIGFLLPVVLICNVIAVSISSGGVILAGNNIGLGKQDEAKRIFNVCFELVCIVSMVYSLLLFFGADIIPQLLGATGDYAREASIYLKGLAFGLTPAIISACMINFLILNGKPIQILIPSVLLFVCAIVTDLVAVRISDSIMGIALATTASDLILFIYLIVSSLIQKGVITFRIARIRIKEIANIIKCGFQSSSSYLFSAVRNTILTKMIAKAGILPVAGYSVAISTSALIESFWVGHITTSNMIASIICVQKNEKAMHLFLKKALKVAVVMLTIVALIYAGLSVPFSKLMGIEEAAIPFAVISMSLHGLSIILNSIKGSFTSVYSVMHRVSTVLFINFVESLGGPLISIFVFGSIFGVVGLYMNTSVGALMAIGVIFIIALVYKKKNNRQKLDFLVLDKDYADSVNYCRSVKNLTEAVEASKELHEFCKEHNVAQKESYYTSLCAEEIMVNIVEHGFTKTENKDCNIICNLNVAKDDVILTVYDNCVIFDPATRFTAFDSNNPTKNIGIRTLYSIAKDVSYQTIFGMNCLIVKI